MVTKKRSQKNYKKQEKIDMEWNTCILVHSYHPIQRQKPTQIMIKFVQNPMGTGVSACLCTVQTPPDYSILSIFICLGVGPCEHTLNHILVNFYCYKCGIICP